MHRPTHHFNYVHFIGVSFMQYLILYLEYIGAGLAKLV